MSTLVAQLAGPLQAWGAEPRLRTATTHTSPTWSGLLGLARAALGHSRTDPPGDVTWLRELDMAVRVDAAGTTHVDFHTINPLPPAYEQFAFVDPSDRGLVPLGTELQKSGQAPRWLKGAAPMVTRRHLLHDASFLWLTSGPEVSLERLADALDSPRWALALGRKSCTPASPLLLGMHPGSIVDAAASVPLTGRGQRFARQAEAVTVPLIWVHGAADPALPTEDTRVVLDHPLGSHPQNGYAAGQHTITAVAAPDTQEALLSWATQHLRHPARTTASEGDTS
jgi:CRISPR system Cascade subunit CasD